MKKSLLAAAVVAGALLSAGCQQFNMGPEAYGSIYSDKTRPVAANGEKIGSKTGTAKCLNVMGLVALGDAGIVAAAKNGGITKVSTVDIHGKWIVVFGEATTQVTGE